ncbi:unnamed protein product [Rotaria socialis]|uniref:Uncharacterized protein n=1 Tax=Rotaria socialis TaxID=392032 RepID=A0A817M4J4_9BILA|nr:unnamed protein product [Rotaria socialis]
MLDVRLIKGKEAENTSSDKRYRLILSDGRNVFSSCVLGADMIDLVDVCNAGVKGDRVILIIREVAVVLSGCEKIGDPAPLGIPKKQRFSTVSKSGLAEKTSNDEWQADDASSIGVVLEKA